MGVTYVTCTPVEATPLPAGAGGDAIWRDGTAAIGAPFVPVAHDTRQKFERIWGDVRTNVGKARNGLKMIERGLAGGHRAAHYDHAATLFDQFWGPVTANRVAAVIQQYDWIRAGLASDITVRHIYPQPATRPGTKASVLIIHKASAPGAGDYVPRIKFFHKLISGGFDVLGANSMWGSLLHEMSHLFLGTRDHVYKPARCIALPVADKITNADNYKYFTELWQWTSLAIAEEKVFKVV